MADEGSFRSSNRLLNSLAHADYRALARFLKPCALERDEVLFTKGEKIETVWFLESAIGSIIAEAQGGNRVESSLVGSDGFLPAQIVMGCDIAAQTGVVQIPGNGLTISSTRLLELARERASLRMALLRFTHVLCVQTAQTVLCNSLYHVDQRLARWLLMCHDRVEGDELPLIHDFMAVMLAVRRPSVTHALHKLEGERLISSERGCVIILDRRALETFAGEIYGEPERVYDRLIPVTARY